MVIFLLRRFGNAPIFGLRDLTANDPAMSFSIGPPRGLCTNLRKTQCHTIHMFLIIFFHYFGVNPQFFQTLKKCSLQGPSSRVRQQNDVCTTDPVTLAGLALPVVNFIGWTCPDLPIWLKSSRFESAIARLTFDIPTVQPINYAHHELW